MAYRPTIREVIFLGLFFIVQFFWLTAAFTYSDTEGRVSGRGDRDRGGPSVSSSVDPSPAGAAGGSAGQSSGTANITLGSAAVRPIPPIASPTSIITGGNSPVSIFTTTTALARGTSEFDRNDLGAQIKRCLVFPILNGVGWPIPEVGGDGDCPLGPTPPGSPRLTVVKVVVNDNGGTATTTDFVLLVGSTTVTSGVSHIFTAGQHTVSEATTTVTFGTTTLTYAQSFSGACDSVGVVSLAPGDVKICTVTNNDSGPTSSPNGGGGGPPGGGGGPPGGGGGPPGGGSTPGGGSPGSGSSGGGGSGSGSYLPFPGQVLGATNPEPEHMGGADGEPGVPNAGLGGGVVENLGLLLFSFVSVMLGLLYICISLRSSGSTVFHGSRA